MDVHVVFFCFIGILGGVDVPTVTKFSRSDRIPYFLTHWCSARVPSVVFPSWYFVRLGEDKICLKGKKFFETYTPFRITNIAQHTIIAWNTY